MELLLLQSTHQPRKSPPPSPEGMATTAQWLQLLRMVALLWISHLCQLADAKQYCMTDSLKVTCSEEQVILMEHAQFGRMELGPCVTRNFGHLGCSRDVLDVLDYWCSGRRTCDVSVSDPLLVRTKPCPLDFSSFLEASYRCIDVIKVAPNVCKKEGHFEVSQSSGYLSGFTTSHIRHGRCPVVVKVEPGQRVSFMLLDFAFGNITVHKSPGKVLEFCQQYAVIKEPTIRSSVPVCSGDKREKQVYLSRTHHVEIALPRGDSSQFVLRYEVTGCPRMRLPEGAYGKYADDSLTVICNSTRESFTLVCRNNSWYGDLQNCSAPVAEYLPGENVGGSMINLPPLGISIIIILGVALVIVVYVAIMIVCVLYVRRRRKKSRRGLMAQQQKLMTPAHQDPGKLSDKESALSAEESLPMLTKSGLLRINGGEYTDICEMHDLAAPCCERQMAADKYIAGKLNTFPQRRPQGVNNDAAVENTAGTACIHRQDGAQTLQGRQRPAVETTNNHVHTVYEPTRTSKLPRSSDARQGYVENPYGFPFYFELERGNGVPKGTAVAVRGVTSPDLVPQSLSAGLCCHSDGNLATSTGHAS